VGNSRVVCPGPYEIASKKGLLSVRTKSYPIRLRLNIATPRIFARRPNRRLPDPEPVRSPGLAHTIAKRSVFLLIFSLQVHGTSFGVALRSFWHFVRSSFGTCQSRSFLPDLTERTFAARRTPVSLAHVSRSRDERPHCGSGPRSPAHLGPPHSLAGCGGAVKCRSANGTYRESRLLPRLNNNGTQTIARLQIR